MRIAMTGFFYGLLTLFSILTGSWCQSFELTSPIEGVEGTNATFYCSTTTQQVHALALSVEVNGEELPASRGSTNNLNDTHKEVTLHNLDRRPFMNFNQPGDNGMPLYCTFSGENSNLVRVQVFYFDYAELSQPASVDEVVWIEQGESREISLNVSAGPTIQSAISRIDGSEASSQISINQSIIITQAGRDISGTYNVTVSNLAGSASFLINIQVVVVVTTVVVTTVVVTTVVVTTVVVTTVVVTTVAVTTVAVTTDSSSNIASDRKAIIIVIPTTTVIVSAIIISVLMIIIIRKKISQKMSNNLNSTPNATNRDSLYEPVGPKLPKDRATFFNKTEDNICSTESNTLSHTKLESNECYNYTKIENSTDSPTKDSNDVATPHCGSLNDDQEKDHFTENTSYASKPECKLMTAEEYHI